jgi:hypothetical protein
LWLLYHRLLAPKFDRRAELGNEVLDVERELAQTDEAISIGIAVGESIHHGIGKDAVSLSRLAYALKRFFPCSRNVRTVRPVASWSRLMADSDAGRSTREIEWSATKAPLAQVSPRLVPRSTLRREERAPLNRLTPARPCHR